VVDEEDRVFTAIGYIADAAVVTGFIIAPLNPPLAAALIVGGRVAGNFSTGVELAVATADAYNGNTGRLVSASGGFAAGLVGGHFGSRLGTRLFGNQQIRNALGQFGEKRANAGKIFGQTSGEAAGSNVCPN
jgi:hypothetical protein